MGAGRWGPPSCWPWRPPWPLRLAPESAAAAPGQGTVGGAPSLPRCPLRRATESGRRSAPACRTRRTKVWTRRPSRVPSRRHAARASLLPTTPRSSFPSPRPDLGGQAAGRALRSAELLVRTRALGRPSCPAPASEVAPGDGEPPPMTQRADPFGEHDGFPVRLASQNRLESDRCRCPSGPPSRRIPSRGGPPPGPPSQRPPVVDHGPRCCLPPGSSIFPTTSVKRRLGSGSASPSQFRSPPEGGVQLAVRDPPWLRCR